MSPPALPFKFKTPKDAARHLGLSDSELKLLKKFIESHMPDELKSGTQSWQGVEGNNTALRWAEHFIAMPLPVNIPDSSHEKTKYAVKRIFQDVHYNLGRRVKPEPKVERTGPSISTLPSFSSIPHAHAPSRSSVALEDNVAFVVEDKDSSRVSTINVHDIASVTYNWKTDILPDDAFEKFVSILEEDCLVYNKQEHDISVITRENRGLLPMPKELACNRHLWNAMKASGGVGVIQAEIVRKGSGSEQRHNIVDQSDSSRKRKTDDDSDRDTSKKSRTNPTPPLTDTQPGTGEQSPPPEDEDTDVRGEAQRTPAHEAEQKEAQEAQLEVQRLNDANLTSRALDWIVSDKESDEKTRFLSFWYRLDPQTKERKCGFVIPGMKIQLFVHQLIAVFWALERSSTTGGGFLADYMGTGKTLMVLAYTQTDYHVQMNIEEVLKSRKDQDGKHLGDMGDPLVTGVGSHSRCPSMLMASDWQYPFRCACEPGSPTMQFRHELRGPSLMIAAPRQLPEWKRKWSEAFVDSPMAVRVWNGWTSSTGMEGCARVTKEALLGAKEPNNELLLQLVLTTWNSYDNHVVGKTKYFETEMRKVPRKSAPQPVDVAKYTEPRWTNVFRDESHEEHSSPRTMNTLGNVTSEYRFFCLSGTVFWQDIGSVEPLWQFWNHANKGWLTRHGASSEEAKKLYQLSGDWLAEAGRQWRRLDDIPESEMGDEDRHTRTRITAEIKVWMQVLMIARKPSSHWNGKPFLEVPPHEDIRIDIILDKDELQIEATSLAEYKDNLVQLLTESLGQAPSPDEIKMALKKHQSRYIKERVLVSWPALAAIVKANEKEHGRPLKLTQTEYLENGRSLGYPLPYLTNLSAIFNGNKKLRELDKIISIIDQEGVDPASNEPSKVLIVCGRDLSTRLVALYLERRGYGCLLYDSPASLKEKVQMIADFQKDTMLEKPEDYDKLPVKPARFLIGTIQCLSSGLDLFKAGDLILWEPVENPGLKRQVRGRISRLGQKRKKTRMWCMQTNAKVDENAEKPQLMDEYVTKMAVDAES